MSDLNFRLEVFEGPLDLLLSLIAKNKVDIYDIPIALILDQYMEYIEQMRQMDMEIAGEFIVMAAELMLIKSRMLQEHLSIKNVQRRRRHSCRISTGSMPGVSQKSRRCLTPVLTCRSISSFRFLKRHSVVSSAGTAVFLTLQESRSWRYSGFFRRRSFRSRRRYSPSCAC